MSCLLSQHKIQQCVEKPSLLRLYWSCRCRALQPEEISKSTDNARKSRIELNWKEKRCLISNFGALTTIRFNTSVLLLVIIYLLAFGYFECIRLSCACAACKLHAFAKHSNEKKSWCNKKKCEQGIQMSFAQPIYVSKTVSSFWFSFSRSQRGCDAATLFTRYESNVVVAKPIQSNPAEKSTEAYKNTRKSIKSKSQSAVAD